MQALGDPQAGRYLHVVTRGRAEQGKGKVKTNLQRMAFWREWSELIGSGGIADFVGER